MDEAVKRSERRRFLAVQAAKAAVGACLIAGFVSFVGLPDRAEGIALAGLLLPAALALLALLGVSLARLELMGLAGLALLIAYLSVLTGGLSSPLVVWLALVPAEAALAGGKSQVWKAALLAALALGLVAAAQALTLLPPSHLAFAGAPPLWQLQAGSLLAALVQAALIAAAAQDRQSEANDAAAHGAAMYRFLAENAQDLITRHGADGRIRYASPAALALLGREPGEMANLSLTDIAHPEDAATLEAALHRSAFRGEPGEAQVRLAHKAGGHVWAEIRCRPARMTIGEAAEIVAVTRDISHIKQQEQALVEARDAALDASRAKSRFLANMSHELRTPLNAIIGFSEMMSREMFGPIGARYQDYAQTIQESGTHLLDLINSVLDMSKIEAGKFDLSEELFEFTETADSALRFLNVAAERAGVSLKLSIAPNARMIYADRRAVKQILVNLLSNGVKFTPPGGEVKIEAAAQGTTLVIAVSDTGRGIAKDDLERLGRPFEQVEEAQSRRHEGTGLGLALVKALAAMHGGEAMLHSALGQGTTVMVRLPYAAVDARGLPLKPRGSNVVALRATA